MFTRRDASTPGQPTREDPMGRTEQPAPPVPAPAPSPPLAAPQATAQPATTGGTESLIAAEDTFEGTLKTATGVRVLGTVRGGIESQRSVRLEAGANVEADITAEEVVIAGNYSGNLTCRNRVEITATGRVSGKLDTARLFLHEGGFFDGELRMQRPADEATKGVEPEANRARRSRYVDITSETPKPAGDSGGDGGKDASS